MLCRPLPDRPERGLEEPSFGEVAAGDAGERDLATGIDLERSVRDRPVHGEPIRQWAVLIELHDARRPGLGIGSVEVRAATRNALIPARPLSNSSDIPSEKNSWSGSLLIFTKGNTAIELARSLAATD